MIQPRYKSKDPLLSGGLQVQVPKERGVLYPRMVIAENLHWKRPELEHKVSPSVSSCAWVPHHCIVRACILGTSFTSKLLTHMPVFFEHSTLNTSWCVFGS